MPDENKEPKPRKKPAQHSEAERKALGIFLAAARKGAGYTQAAAAKAVGMSDKQGISNFENGQNVPDAIRLRQLARLYETSVDVLVGNSPLSAKAVQIAKRYDQLESGDRDAFDKVVAPFLTQGRPVIEAREQSRQEIQSEDAQAARDARIATNNLGVPGLPASVNKNRKVEK